MTALVAPPALPSAPAPAGRLVRPIPAHHPVRLLGSGPDGVDRSLLLQVTGGWTDPAAPTLTHWAADYGLVRHDRDMAPVPVAHLDLTVVTPALGDPAGDLDRVDQDSGELGAALFVGQRCSPGFAEVADTDDRPVLLVDTFEVEPAWRGTDLTPLLAVRALGVFASLGLTCAALCAAPIAEEMSGAERDRIAARIASMWARAGFRPVPTSNPDGDNLVMAARLDPAAAARRLRLLVGDSPALRVAAALP